MAIVNKGFHPKRAASDRLPPGQYETQGFPVLSLGPTPLVPKEDWSLTVFGLVENKLTYDWADLNKLPLADLTADIHCVTKWSKFDTKWRGVWFDEIIKLAKVKPNATHLIAHSSDGYTTNIPLSDVVDKQCLVATAYDEKPIPAEHGGPVRLVIPHLYFWKSAKWLKGLEFLDKDKPGFWETRGYHNYGDPWKEERYWND